MWAVLKNIEKSIHLGVCKLIVKFLNSSWKEDWIFKKIRYVNNNGNTKFKFVV